MQIVRRVHQVARGAAVAVAAASEPLVMGTCSVLSESEREASAKEW